MVQDDPEDVNGTAPPLSLFLTKTGTPKAIVANLMTIFTSDRRWQGALQYNALTDDLLFAKRPPYVESPEPWTPRSLDEQCDYTETNNWLQHHYGLATSEELTYRAMLAIGLRASFHPIRDYLQGLQTKETWDKTPRLDTWLHTYCHTDDTPYTRAAGRKTLLAAVARIMQPGCKADTVCILEGKQGTYKSTVWRVLASDAWFSDDLPDLHDKDAQQALRGKWIIEIQELATLHRSEVEVVKRFISKMADYYRNSYGRRATDHLRQNVFVATTNRKDYFKDDTGNRRFWPIACTGYCDTDALAADRDQLWAEAMHWYTQRAQWHLTAEEERLAMEQQADRLEPDDWEPLVFDYVDTLKRPSSDQLAPYVTTKEVLEHLFRPAPEDQPIVLAQANTKRIGAILQRHHWEHDTIRDAKHFGKSTSVKIYRRPVPEPTPATAATAPPETGSSECASNTKPATCATRATGTFTDEEEKSGKDNSKTNTKNTGSTGSTGSTRVNTGANHATGFCRENTGSSTPVADSERPTGVSPTSNASGLAVSEATFPPGRSLPGEAGEVLSREGLSERSERPLTGSPTRVPSPSPGGSGAAGAGALACSCGGLWLPTGDGRCTRCNAVRP